VTVAAAVVLLTSVALAISLLTGGSSGLRPRSGETTPARRHPAPPSAHSQASPGANTTAPTSTTPSTVAAGPGPTLSTLTPSGGSAGQSVVISGTSFMSADGHIVARFGAQTAPTRCPDLTSCTVTVPPLAGPLNAVPVTITTDAGVSNALTFTYG